MAYFVAVFSPQTYEAFSSSDRTIYGCQRRLQQRAAQVKIGDRLVCYMKGLSRWVGLLEIASPPYLDETPLFVPQPDPFVVRFKVTPIAWLPMEKAIPIRDKRLWNALSFTRGRRKNSGWWTGRIRKSLNQLDDEDGALLERTIMAQLSAGVTYPFDQGEHRKRLGDRVRRGDREVFVVVPQGSDDMEGAEEAQRGTRESLEIQARLAKIGYQMGMQIWVPASDRSAVLKICQELWPTEPQFPLLDDLPLNYDDTTVKTIKQIDVLWLRNRSITRAFEVEHTTSVYSGILRMADLLALLPNLDIRLHIVAPSERRVKVFQELRRPVFSLLERGPLAGICTYLSYEHVREIAGLPHLSRLSDKVLDDYEEKADA